MKFYGDPEYKISLTNIEFLPKIINNDMTNSFDKYFFHYSQKSRANQTRPAFAS
jgi:hypothetical protein